MSGFYDLSNDPFNSDWIRTMRLVEAAKNGDKEAQKKLDELNALVDEPGVHVFDVLDPEIVKELPGGSEYLLNKHKK